MTLKLDQSLVLFISCMVLGKLLYLPQSLFFYLWSGDYEYICLIGSVLWLTLCQLDWSRDVQIAGKILFLHVSVRVFPNEITIWISSWMKITLTMQVDIIQSFEGLTRLSQHGRGRMNLLSSYTGTSIFSCHQTILVLLVLWPSNSDQDTISNLLPHSIHPILDLRPLGWDWNYTTSFLGLQLAEADHGVPQPP